MKINEDILTDEGKIICELTNAFTNKNKEIERLNNIINNDFSKICREKMIDKLSANEMILLQNKEIERLQNIINELEEWLEQEYAIVKSNSIEEPNNPEWYIKWNERKIVLDKIKELKGE